MKALKIIFGILLVLVLLVVTAAIALPFIIDPNDYRDEIAEQVEKATGRSLALNGELKLSVFPWLGVELNDVEFGNAPGFEPENMASMNHAQVKIKLLPLLKKQVEVDTVNLDAAKIWLTVKADGSNNWQDLVESDPAAEEPSESSKAPSIESLDIAGVSLTNAEINYRDEQTNSSYSLSQVNIKTGALASEQAFPLTFSGQAATSAPVTNIGFAGETEVLINLANRSAAKITLDGLSLELDAKGEAVPGGKTELNVVADVNADLAEQTLKVTNLMLELPQMKARGELNGTQIIDAPSFTGRLDIPEFNARELVAEMVADWEQPADPKALTQVSLNTKFTASTNSAELSGLNIKLDDTQLQGSGGIDNFADPSIRFDLAVDKLDVDRYLPPALADETEEQAAKAEPYNREEVDAITLPVDFVKDLKLNGQAKVGELKMAGAVMRDVQLKLQANNGKAAISPLSANLYGGTTQFTASVDVTGAKPVFRFTPTVENIESAAIQQDMMEKTYLTGLADLGGSGLTASGNTVGELRRSLNGDLSYLFEDGAVQGFDVVKKLMSGLETLFPNASLSAKAAATESKFAELKGSLSIENGIATTRNFQTQQKNIQITGVGTGNLIEEFLGYEGSITLQPGFADSIGVKEVKILEGQPIPLRCKATAGKQDCDIKLGSALKALGQAKLDEAKAEAKERIDAEVDKQTERLKEKAEEKLGETLKDKAPDLLELFKRK